MPIFVERMAAVKTSMGVINACVMQDSPPTARKEHDAQVSEYWFTKHR